MRCENCDTQFKWSWAKFFKGKCSNKFIAWIAATAVIVWIIAARLAGDHSFAGFEKTVLIIWGAVTFIFMLSGSIDTAVANMKISAELKAGAQMAVNTDTAKAIEVTQ